MGLAMLTLASCDSDIDFQRTAEPTAINITSNVAQTRSADINLQKTQIAQGVEVGVFVQAGAGFITNGDNAKLTADGFGTFTGTKLYFPTDGAAVSVYAYAPYNSAFAGKADQDVAFTVASDQSSDAGYLKSDLLCGAPEGTNSFTEETPNVLIGFKHMLSKLTVKFTTSEETDVDLKGATIKIVGTLPSTTLNVINGTIGAASGSATDIKAVTFASDATEFQASAVVVPQTVAAGSFVQVILSDKLLNAQLNADATFVSGKAYTYNVNISGQGAETKAEIVLSSVVTDWDEETEELSGDITEEELPEAEPITLTATFQTPGANATYVAPTYTWTAGNNNLMTVFEFANGELANYSTLTFTFSSLVDGPVRMGYYVGSAFTEFNNGYYSAGTKTVDLTTLGIDLSTVTRIAFGGRSNAGSCEILANEVYLTK